MHYFGDYILLRELKTGGMADIFQAVKVGTNNFFKLCAVKRIKLNISCDQSFQDMFIQEAKVQSSFSHENVISIFDFGKEHGQYYIAMEYLNGVTLREVISALKASRRETRTSEALYIIQLLLKGLDYIHTLEALDGTPLNIVHRDVDPQNIFLTYQGQVKLIDFGIAKDDLQREITQVGTIKGKFSYIAPEVHNGKRADRRADIYSAGLVFYEILAQKKLFDGKTLAQVISNISTKDVKADITRLKIDDRLKSIIYRMLIRDPNKRYGSADQVLKDLNSYLTDEKILLTLDSFLPLLTILFKEEQEIEKKETQKLFKQLGAGKRPTENIDETVILNHDETVLIGRSQAELSLIDQFTKHLQNYGKRYLVVSLVTMVSITALLTIIQFLSDPIGIAKPKIERIVPMSGPEPELIVEPETNLRTESKPEVIAEPETNPVPESQPEVVAETETNPVPEPERISESQTSPILEPQPDPISESQPSSTILISGTPVDQLVYLDNKAQGDHLPIALVVEPGSHQIMCISNLRPAPQKVKVNVYARQGMNHPVDCTIVNE